MQKPAPHVLGYTAQRPLAAIGLMCLTCALFACLDTTAKYLGSATDLPILQIVWMRFLGQLAAMVALLGLLAVPDLMRTRKLWVQIVRSFLLLGSTASNFLALRYLQLDQTTTIGFLAPLAIALLAGPLLGEWIGWRRALAIAVGFCGALVAIRPGFASVHPAVLLAFGTMLCMAFFGIVRRCPAAATGMEMERNSTGESSVLLSRGEHLSASSVGTSLGKGNRRGRTRAPQCPTRTAMY